MEDEEDNVRNPTPEEWEEMMKDPAFAEFIRSMPPPPWAQEDKDEE
jgi:hypothetical protein